MTKEYLDQLNGYLNNDINTFSGGINTYMDKAFINPDQMPYCMNMTMWQPPMMCTRAKRRTLLSAPIEDGKKIYNIWAYNDTLVLYLLGDVGSTTAKLYVRYKDEDYNVTTVFSTPDIPIDAEFCYCRNGTTEYVYICSSNYKAHVTLNFSALLPQDIVTAYTPMLDGHYGYAAFHKGRLFFADSTTNIITFSALWDFDNFTEVPAVPDPDVDYSSYAGDFLVTNATGHIRKIISFDSKLVIFCEHSIHLMYGDTPLTSSANQFQLVDMNNNLGCIATGSVAIGGGKLFWLGDDWEIYEYDGSYIDVVSRPAVNKRVQRNGGISNIEMAKDRLAHGGAVTKEIYATATANKYYIALPAQWLPWYPVRDNILFVYDTRNALWWAEDGNIKAIANLSFGDSRVVMNIGKDLLITTDTYDGYDEKWTGVAKQNVPITYEFHTRVYGADGLDSRKSIDKVWTQASANADVYLIDAWTSTDNWKEPIPEEAMKKIGTLEKKATKELNQEYLATYHEGNYEQQCCIVPKMYGQRLNTFQIIVKGEGKSKFYLMKRDWCAR